MLQPCAEAAAAAAAAAAADTAAADAVAAVLRHGMLYAVHTAA